MSRKNWRIKASATKPAKDDPKPFYLAATGAACSIKAAEGNDESGKPRLATFAGNAYTGAPMKPDGWGVPIICDLGGIKVPSQHRPALRQHDPEQIVGHTESVKVDKEGIQVAGKLSGEQQHTDKVRVPAANGFQWQLSIGANPTRTSFLEAGETATVNGREISGPMTIAHETEIGEISFVPLGADGDTSATVQGSKGKVDSAMSHKQLFKFAKASGNVKAAKYNDDEIDKMDEDKAKAALRECMAAESDDDKAKAAKAAADEKDKADAAAKAKANAADDDKDAKAAADERIKASRKADADEARRVSSIKATSKRYSITSIQVDAKPVDFVAHAIENGWSEDKIELEALKASRASAAAGNGPHLHFGSQPEVTEAVLEMAVLEAGRSELWDSDFYAGSRGDRAGMKARDADRIKADLKRRYPEKVQDDAHRIFKGRIGLQQLLTTIAAAGDYRGRETISDDNLGQVAAACMRQLQIHADGSSTISIANVTANVQNKFLLQGYYYTEQAWKEIAGILSVKDFKPTKSINLFGDSQFKPLGSSGELDNATLQDQAFANQVATSGRIITIPRTAIINDDISALTMVPMILGRGAGLRLNFEFWTRFLSPGFDNGGATNFFAATHTIANEVGNSNLSSGAGSALTSPGLTAATLLFDRQIDPVGNPLGVDAEILLYPPELQTAALELMNSQYIIMAGLASTSSASKQPSDNIWKGRYRPVKSRYLSNSAYTGYSALSWYLLANPSILPVIQAAFLNGQETPTVQVAGPDFQFNILGITTRAFFDIGMAMQNFRGGVKSAGS